MLKPLCHLAWDNVQSRSVLNCDRQLVLGQALEWVSDFLCPVNCSSEVVDYKSLSLRAQELEY